MKYSDAKKRLEAAHSLFLSSNTSREKLSSVRALVQGAHPGIDEKLKKCDDAFSYLETFGNVELIELSADHLPENTDEEKKRKKAILLYIKFWKDLQSEIARVRVELNAPGSAENPLQKRSFWQKIFSAAKGPFGIVTIVAVGAALILQATSVRMVIKNNGCGTMTPASLPIPLSGLSLPKDPISNGGSATATLPRVTVSIDSTKPGSIHFSALKLSMTFEIPSNISDVTFNGESLLKKKLEIHLSDRKEHTLIFLCKK